MKTQLLLITAALAFMAGSVKSQCNASFTYTSGPGGYVSFASTSTGVNAGTKYTWFMGNGAYMPNVSDTAGYTYCFNGSYQASLVILDSLGSCWDSTAVTINVSNSANANCLPANYTHTVTGGQVACSLTSPTAFSQWDFGDYTGIVYNNSSPSHNYTQNGTFTVTCVTQYQYGNYNIFLACDTFSQVVTVSSVPCVASFWADSNNTNNKLYVYNTSQGASSVFYSANGGSWVPGAVYPAVLDSFMNLPAGNNVICQKIYGNGCADSICVNVFVNCMISETHTATCGQVSFSATGNPGITSAAWYIGGNLVSTQVSPVINYTNTSSFYISYTLQTSLCQKTDSVFVQVGPTPMFYLYPDSVSGPGNWLVYVDNQANYVSYHWDWGDGTTSNIAMPTHTYTNAGWYTICLTIHNNCGDSATYCSTDSLYKAAGSMVGIIVMPQNPGVGITSNTSTNIKLYPIPASDFVTLEGLEQAGRVELYDNEGRMVMRSAAPPKKSIIHLKDLSAGFYILKVYSGNEVWQRKIMKQ